MEQSPQIEKPLKIDIENYLTGERCFISSISIDDFSDEDYLDIARICNEEDIYNYLFREKLDGKPYPVEKAKSFIAWADNGWKTGKYFPFIIRNSEGRIIGAIDIKSDNLEEAEIGYWLSRENRGVMTNAVNAICNIAKSAGYKSLYANIRTSNIKSVGVIERSGFVNGRSLNKDEKDYFVYVNIF